MRNLNPRQPVYCLKLMRWLCRRPERLETQINLFFAVTYLIATENSDNDTQTLIILSIRAELFAAEISLKAKMLS